MVRALASLLVSAACLMAMPGPASAIDVQCIEASRYKHIWRIFGGDSKKFASYFGIDAAKLPSPELCRAGLVVGQVVQGQDVDKLLDFVIQNRGWLSTLYLASSGGSVTEGVRLAYLVRSFWLKTEAVVSREVTYRPDFILPQFMLKPPAPVSQSMPSTAEPMPAMFESLATVEDFEAYLKIRNTFGPLRLGQGNCASACSYLYVAGVDRMGVVQVHRPRLSGKDQPIDLSKSLSETEEGLQRSEALIVGLYREMDAGPSFISIFQATPTQTVAPAADGRLPRYVADFLFAKCGADVAHLQDVETELRVVMIELGARNFGGAPLFGSWINLDAVRTALTKVHERRRKVEQCTAAAHENERLTIFAKLCGESCDRAKLIANVDTRLRNLRAKVQ